MSSSWRSSYADALNLPRHGGTYPSGRPAEASLACSSDRPLDTRSVRSNHLIENFQYSREVIMDVNPDRLNSFIGKMLGDVGAAMNASLMLIGDKLGLYKTLAAKGPLTSTELAQATKTSERYIREWLAAQAASGYVDYDAASGKFSMTPGQTLVLKPRGRFTAPSGPARFSRRSYRTRAAPFRLRRPAQRDARACGRRLRAAGWRGSPPCIFTD